MSSLEPLFPEAPRVIYDRSPLNEVICQLRFPAILRIDTQLPAEFQEAIRGTFPHYEKTQAAGLQQIPQQVMEMMGAPFAAVTHQFGSGDGSSRITLTKDSLALSAGSYERWEIFSTHLKQAVGALVTHYAPSFYTRIGLRYSNVIRRSALKLQGCPWSKLIRPEILAEMGLPQWEDRVEDARRAVRVRMLDDVGSIFFQHGLAQVQGQEEICYLLDFDFYTDKKTELGDAGPTIERFHQRSGRAFRWCITDFLHDAMGPRQLDHDGDR